MSDTKDDLPGFYRDPKTGKYYREKPESAVNPSLKKLKKAREETFRSVNKRPEFNILKYLRTNELGLIHGLHAEREFLKMKTYNKWLREEVSLNDFELYNIVSVKYIKCSEKSVFGVWDVKERIPCVVGERTHYGLPYHPKLGFRACYQHVIDMCEGPEDTLIYLYSTPYVTGCYAFLPQTPENVGFNSARFIPLTTSFCCSSVRRGAMLAFGCEECIRFHNGFSFEKNYPVRGRVHTVSFDDSSNLMISGVHSGHLYVHDIRQKELQMSFEVSRNCVNDSCFLDTNQVIIAGPGNVLKKIDLRMKKTVTEYFGHKSSMRKRPFSIANNMLCASGTDHIIRIWHVSGGNPVHEMRPINSPDNETRGWLYSNCNKTYLYQFEEHFKRVYEIT